MKLIRIIKSLLVVGTLGCGAQMAFAQGSDPFLGQLAIVPYTFAPAGWALCQGQILSISQNTALFSLLGTTYGGDGRTTFALPDLRGRFPIGQGQGPGLSEYDLGQTGGHESYTLTVAQLPAHTHPLPASNGEATLSSPSGAVLGSKARVPLYNGVSDGTTMAPTGVAGGNQPYQVLSPYLALNYIIALQGIYPSRN